jgi:predicted RNA-binding Zn-ribbon protein involved in translation (DUF1610 family)
MNFKKYILFVAFVFGFLYYSCSVVDHSIWNEGYCTSCNKEKWQYDERLHLLYCPRCGYYYTDIYWCDSTMIQDVIRREQKQREYIETINNVLKKSETE